MSPSFAASMRRTRRLLRPRGQAKALRKVQKAAAKSLVTAAYAPFTAANAKLAKQRSARKTAVVPKVPDGARYLSRRYRGAAGTRAYKLYLPASQPERPKALIVMLHGCFQSPDDFAVGTHMNQLAEKHGIAIAYPHQTRQDNPRSCWNWFRPGDQARGSGEPAILAGMTRKLMKELRVDRDSTFVAGLSAGGAMAAILVDEYPDIFAGAGIHSGLARGAAQDVTSAMSAMRNGRSGGHAVAGALTSSPVRRIVFQGDKDSTVHPSNADEIVAAALGADAVPLRVVSRSVRGRAYSKTTYAASAGAGPLELWVLAGAGHAWSGGRKAGSFTDSLGPDASAQMVRFFLAKPT